MEKKQFVYIHKKIPSTLYRSRFIVKTVLLSLLLLLSFAVLSAEPRLECEKKWGEAKFKGKKIKRYRLRGSDFPQGDRFRLYVKWFNGEEAGTFAYVSNHRGYLILDEELAEDPLYALCPLKLGERITFLMRSEENPSFAIETSVIPFPLEFKTDKGARISLELKGQDGEAFLLQGRKFHPRESFELCSSFQGKENRYFLIASADGAVTFPFILDLDDLDGGECLLTVKRKGEEYVISFHVGRAALGLAGGFALKIR